MRLKCFVGEGPFCKRVPSPTPPPPKTFISVQSVTGMLPAETGPKPARNRAEKAEGPETVFLSWSRLTLKYFTFQSCHSAEQMRFSAESTPRCGALHQWYLLQSVTMTEYMQKAAPKGAAFCMRVMRVIRGIRGIRVIRGIRSVYGHTHRVRRVEIAGETL